MGDGNQNEGQGSGSESWCQEPSDVPRYGQEEPKSGIKLTNRPPSPRAYESALKVELLEDLILPDEWPRESEWYYRVFRVPAMLLNQLLGHVTERDGPTNVVEALDTDDEPG